MARGKHEEHNPNRRVSRADMLFGQLQGMIEGTTPARNSLAKMWAELPDDSGEMCSGPSCGATATTEAPVSGYPMCQNCAESELHADRNTR